MSKIDQPDNPSNPAVVPSQIRRPEISIRRWTSRTTQPRLVSFGWAPVATREAAGERRNEKEVKRCLIRAPFRVLRGGDTVVRDCPSRGRPKIDSAGGGGRSHPLPVGKFRDRIRDTSLLVA
jgi:hypothetical protein